MIDEEYVSLNCIRGVSLDGVSLPQFDCERNVERAHFLGCAPPLEGYAAILRKLNVTPRINLTLADLPVTNLSRAHFTNLTQLRALQVRHTHGYTEPQVHVDSDFLSPFDKSLRVLKLLGVALTLDTLLALPQQLEELEIIDATLKCEDGCAAAFQRLQRLQTLRLTDMQLHATPTLSAATALRRAYVTAPLRQSLLSKNTTMENVTFLYVLLVVPLNF